MKVVLDSSVLIAASISRAGVCAELLEDVLTHHELIISDLIAEELGRKLRDKFDFPESEVRQLRRLLLHRGGLSPPTPCRSPGAQVSDFVISADTARRYSSAEASHSWLHSEVLDCRCAR